MGEKMKNAPVYFTIVQARFNPILALDSYAPMIQESLRKQGFPDAQKGVLATFNLNLAAPSDASPPQVPVTQATRYLFSNIQKTAGFVLDQGALSYQATEYDVFETFSAAFLKGLNTVHEAVTLSYTDRIGVRYLDAVFPEAGEALPNYLNESVLGLYGKLDGQLVHAFTETLTETADASIMSRIIIQEGEVGFPPDLQPMSLVVQEKFRNLRGVHAILDTDGWYGNRELFSLESIRNRLSAIHRQVGKSFKASVTAHALKTWE